MLILLFLFLSEYGKQPSIVRVQNGMVTVRRGDGALVVSSFYTFFTNLHRHILQNRWSEGLSLCRIAQVIFSLICFRKFFIEITFFNLLA